MENQFEATQEEMRCIWIARCMMAGVPDGYLEKTFDDFEGPDNINILEQVQAYERDFFSKSSGGLVFCGGPGTGKTLLACILVGYLCGRGYSSRIAVWPDLLNELEESRRFDSPKPKSEILFDLKGYDFLVIDDIGVPVTVPAEREKAYLYEIIDIRSRCGRALALICNLNIKELAAFLGDRCLDRVQGSSSVYVFQGDSWRGRKAKE